MKMTQEKNLTQKGNKRKWKSRWKKIVSTLAAVTVFCTTYALILPAITVNSDTYCGMEEHEHTDSCYTKELICGLKEGASSEARTEKVTRIEKQQVLVNEGHVHGDSCYSVTTNLICGQAESEPVVDADGNTISAGHVHSAECYEEVRTLTCGQEESAPVYEEREVEVVEEVVIPAGESHVHTDACYNKILTCGKNEHKHVDECFSNPTLDLETAADWEKTLPKEEEFTENWAEDTLLVAKSQLGYRESTRNFKVYNGERKGYTRYGAMYGIPYGDWCAMFLQFSMHYAGVDSRLMPASPGVGIWIRNMEKLDNYFLAEDYIPEAGDIVFIDWDSKRGDDADVRDGDHVGIVAEVKTEEKTNEEGEKIEVPVAVIALEGNSSGEVKYNTYKIDDDCLMGYAKIPEKPETDEELEERLAEIEKIDFEDGTTEVEETEEVEENLDAIIALASYTESGVQVKFEAPSSVFPEGTVDPALNVVEILPGTPEYDEYYAQAEANAEAGRTVLNARFFDISVVDLEGNEIKLNDESLAKVEIVFPENETMTTAGNIDILHFAEAGLEVLESQVQGGEAVEAITFDTTSFSPYGVVQTQGEGEGSGSGSGSGSGTTTLTPQHAKKNANGEYVVTSWYALRELIEIESRKYIDVDGTEKTDAPNTMTVVIDGNIAADSKIKISNTQTITLKGTNNAHIYVDNKEGVKFNNMFWVDGGTLNVEAVTFSGRKADFTAGGTANACVKTTVDSTDYDMLERSKVSYTKGNSGTNTCTYTSSNFTKIEKIDENSNRYGLKCIYGTKGSDYYVLRATSASTSASLVFTRKTGGYVDVRIDENSRLTVMSGNNPYGYVRYDGTITTVGDFNTGVSNGTIDATHYSWTIDYNNGNIENYHGQKIYEVSGNAVFIKGGYPAGCDSNGGTNPALKVGNSDGSVSAIAYGNTSNNGNKLSTSSGASIGVYKRTTTPEGAFALGAEAATGSTFADDNYGYYLKTPDNYYLVANDAGGSTWVQNSSDTPDKWDSINESTAAWHYDSSKGIFRNKKTEQVIYYDGTNLYVRKLTDEVTGPFGCDSTVTPDTCTPVEGDYTDDSVFTKDTKGFFIAADNGAEVNLKSGTVLEGLIYTASNEDLTDDQKKDVAPIRVRGDKTKLNLEGAVIQNNKINYPKRNKGAGATAEEMWTAGKAMNFSQGATTTRWGQYRDGEYAIAGPKEGAKLSTGSAGGIIVEGSTVNIKTGTEIKKNEADAGAIIIKGGGTVNHDSGKIKDNLGFNSGAVYIDDGTYNMEGDAEVSGNRAWWNGTISAATAKATFNMGTKTGSTPTITGNTNLQKGGGVYVASNNVNLRRGTISNNTSFMFGGGVYVDKGFNLYLANTSISGNHADKTVGGQRNGNLIDQGFIRYDMTAAGGGVWTCPTDVTYYNNQTVYIYNNDANGTAVRPKSGSSSDGDGEDFYIVSPSGGGSVRLFNPPGTWEDVRWVDSYGNNRTEEETTIAAVQEKGSFARGLSMTNKDGQASDLNITGNTAVMGGGIGSNGTLVFSENVITKDVTATLRVGKAWLGNLEKENVRVTVNIYDNTAGKNNAKLVASEQVILGNDSDEDAGSGTGVVIKNPDNADPADYWLFEMTLPEIIVPGETDDTMPDNATVKTVSVYEKLGLGSSYTKLGKFTTDGRIDLLNNLNLFTIEIIEEVPEGDSYVSATNKYVVKLDELYGRLDPDKTDTKTVEVRPAMNGQGAVNMTTTYKVYDFRVGNPDATSKGLKNEPREKYGKVSITKKDKATNSILTSDDFVFEYIKVNKTGDTYQNIEGETWTTFTNVSGVHTSGRLKEGYYAIKESATATGYAGLGENLIYIHVSGDGSVTRENSPANVSAATTSSLVGVTGEDAADAGQLLSFDVLNEKSVGLEIKKVDASGNALNGGETTFRIVSFSGQYISKPITFGSQTNSFRIDNIKAWFTNSNNFATNNALSESDLKSTSFYIEETTTFSNRYEKITHVIPFKLSEKSNGTYWFTPMTKWDVDNHVHGRGRSIDDVTSRITPTNTFANSNNVKPVDVKWDSDEKVVDGHTTKYKVTNVTTSDDGAGSVTFTVKNAMKPVEVKVAKVDAEGNAITDSNTKFTLRPAASSVGALKAENSANGIYVFNANSLQNNPNRPVTLTAGNAYAIWEATAPNGYEKLGLDVFIEIDEHGSVRLVSDKTELETGEANGRYVNANPEKLSAAIADGTVSISAPDSDGIVTISIENEPSSNTPAKLRIVANKEIVNGQEGEDYSGDFTFRITGERVGGGSGDVPMPEITTASNSSDGTIDFGIVTYETAGTFRYTITEVAGSDSSITYDDRAKVIDVVVEEINIGAEKKYVVTSVTSNSSLVEVTETTEAYGNPQHDLGTSGSASSDKTYFDYNTSNGTYSHLSTLIKVDGYVAFCIDPELPPPAGTTFTQKPQLDDKVTRNANRIKKAMYYGYPHDSNDGYLVKRIIKELSKSTGVTYNQESASRLLAEATLYAIGEIANDKTKTTSAYYSTRNTNDLSRVIIWIYDEVEKTNNDDVIKYVGDLKEFYTNARPHSSTGASSYQKIITAVVNSRVQKVEIKAPFTNTIDKTSYEVTKTWVDEDNPQRPTSITVKLYKKVGENLEEVTSAGTKTLNAGNSWYAKWDNLARRDSEGNLIKYVAREVVPSGYTESHVDIEAVEGGKQPTTTTRPTYPQGCDYVEAGGWSDVDTSADLNGKQVRIVLGNSKALTLGSDSSLTWEPLSDSNTLWTLKGSTSGGYQLHNGSTYVTYVGFYLWSATEKDTVRWDPRNNVLAAYYPGDYYRFYVNSDGDITYDKDKAGTIKLQTYSNNTGAAGYYDSQGNLCEATGEEEVPTGEYVDVDEVIGKTEITNTLQKHDIVIWKVDADSQTAKLPGATFTLTDINGKSFAVTAVAGEDGKYKAEGLVKGVTYTLNETGAPNNYMVLMSPVSFTLNDHGGITLAAGTTTMVSAEVNSLQITVQNKKYPSVKIKKVDVAKPGVVLADAEFELRSGSENGPKVGETHTTGSDGYINLGSLQQGTYYLIETKAPPGYNKLLSPITITVSASGTVTVTGSNVFAESSVAPPEHTAAENAYVFTLGNSAGEELPETGGIGTTILYVAGAILVIGAGILLIVRKKSR